MIQRCEDSLCLFRLPAPYLNGYDKLNEVTSEYFYTFSQISRKVTLKVSKCFREWFSKSWRHTTAPLFSLWFWFRWLRTRLRACIMRYRQLWWNFQVFTLQQSHLLRQQNLRNNENFLAQYFCNIPFKASQKELSLVTCSERVKPFYPEII